MLHIQLGLNKGGARGCVYVGFRIQTVGNWGGTGAAENGLNKSLWGVWVREVLCAGCGRNKVCWNPCGI